MKLDNVTLKETETSWTFTITFDPEFSTIKRGAVLLLWKGRPLKDVLHNLFLFVESVARLLSEE